MIDFNERLRASRDAWRHIAKDRGALVTELIDTEKHLLKMRDQLYARIDELKRQIETLQVENEDLRRLHLDERD